MKSSKRSLSLVLALVLVLALSLALPAMAAGEEAGEALCTRGEAVAAL